MDDTIVVTALETLILSVLGLGLAIALCSPVSVVTVIILLSMPAGRRRACAFVAGWLLAIVVIAAISVTVLQSQDFSSHKTTPSRAASAAEILLGCIVLVASGRAFRRRTRGARSDEAPKWLGRLDRTPWLFAVLVGAFMLTYSLTLAAGGCPARRGISRRRSRCDGQALRTIAASLVGVRAASA